MGRGKSPNSNPTLFYLLRTPPNKLALKNPPPLQISSTSNCTDYQSRRLGIRYRPASAKQGPGVEYAHTLNGTAIAVPRIIIAILENFQLADGSVEVPEVLRSWMGKEVIKCGA